MRVFVQKKKEEKKLLWNLCVTMEDEAQTKGMQ